MQSLHNGHASKNAAPSGRGCALVTSGAAPGLEQAQQHLPLPLLSCQQSIMQSLQSVMTPAKLLMTAPSGHKLMPVTSGAVAGLLL